MDGEFAVEHHMGHVQPDQHSGALHAMLIQDHGAYGDFSPCAGCGGHGDNGNCLASYGQKLQEQGFDAEVRHLHPCGDHLASVHHRAATQGYDALGLALQSRFSPAFNKGDGGLGVDFIENGIMDPGFGQGLRDDLLITETA